MKPYLPLGSAYKSIQHGICSVVSPTIRLAVPALLLSALLLLPFLNKAFTFDDTLFMAEARHALRDPLHPTAFEITWQQPIPRRVSKLVPNGPVMAWLLMPSAVADRAEPVAHGCQLALLGLAILATVSLARRLRLDPVWAAAAGLLVVAMPAVLAMAGTAMPDVLAMALGVTGIERLLAWGEERTPARMALAALLLGLAPLARLHLLLLLVVGALLLIGPVFSLELLRNRIRLFIPLAGALLVMAAVIFVTSDLLADSGTLVTTAKSASSTSIGRIAVNAISIPVHWVLAMAFGLPWLALRWRVIVRNRTTLFAGCSGILFSAVILKQTGTASLFIPLIAGVGLVVLWDVLADGLMRRDMVQLALGLWLLISLPIVTYAYLPAKFLVPSAPAAALLIVRELSSRSGRLAWVFLGITIVLGASLGVAILRADSSFAGLGRQAATELIAPQVSEGHRVWFVGNLGFQWYAEKAGGCQVTLTPPFPRPGDLLVQSIACTLSLQSLNMIKRDYPRLIQVDHLEDSEPGGRIMDKELGAGFYHNSYGYWPWVWGDTAIDRFYVWRID